MFQRQVAALLVLFSFGVAGHAQAQATGTEYVTFWRGDLRIIATEPNTKVDIIDISNGLLFTSNTLLVAGDSWETFSSLERRIRIVATDSTGAGDGTDG